MIARENIQQIDPYRFLIPQGTRAGMRTDAMIFADSELMEHIVKDLSLEQAVNVASLPGIVGPALAMPDIHQGYGFPIGGVAATDWQHGVVSPGGVGFDINCGVRLLGTSLTEADVRPRLRDLVLQLFRDVPCGTGGEGCAHVTSSGLRQLLVEGSPWMVENGYGEGADAEFTESGGRLRGADPDKVSPRALERGRPQVGSLGSGNHFLEVQWVEQIVDQPAAEALGLQAGQVVVLIHSGSRGLGHQVCTDYVKQMAAAMQKYNITLPDRQLACAPIQSPEGQAYLAAMAAAANFAWANRQGMTHYVRKAIQRLFGGARVRVIYDVAHNIAKREKHLVPSTEPRLLTEPRFPSEPHLKSAAADQKERFHRPGETRTSEAERDVLVHRKGATRAFPPGHPEIPARYRHVGQPVLIPGSMGTASWVLVGAEGAMRESFGSVCHGAGRLLSRTAAKKGHTAKEVQQALEERGIIVKSETRDGIVEEIPEAYKDVDAVINVVHNAGLARKVARLRPMGVIKG